MTQQSIDRHSMQTCQVCRSAMSADVGELHFDHDGFEIVVSGVPMSVCRECGEQYVPGPIAAMISDLVADAVTGLEADLRRSRIASPRRLEISLNENVSERDLALA